VKSKVLSCPMDPETNDAGASSVGEYLIKLLAKVWEEQDNFDGKRPFGNSDWEYDIHAALVRDGLIEGSFDSEGFLDECDSAEGRLLVADAIDGMVLS
jgi:hypothetical protein